MLLKALAIGLLLALGEIINGNIRVRVLHRLYEQRRAKTLSLLSGIAIIFAITWLALPWVAPTSYLDCLKLGLVWLIIMLSLDIFVGRYLFKYKWQRIFDDFNLFKGNLLSVGMLLLFISPSLVFWLQMKVMV
ncbi:hypothetical protein PI2015_1686 [Pseudoalteromonas issachenkonii]|uniref:Uncharacterized protein n=1 Tax=Pseudoalteromonas issachenkonii TaxID=152297 RepID=A0ABN5C110_9GAMM|nr:hypothetical protein [Pseudoalteromonas issachenkonii]ALQ54980.1 hypothetical protein PI2015_1686 [Pseudoalteromonas issachenkonii]ATC90807.1 hypothetical protein PISS_a1938 [Pseudoalteromonas issachenkonii]